MAVMVGHNSRIGMTGSLLNERHDGRSGGRRDIKIAEPMECANAKIGYQHQES